MKQRRAILLLLFCVVFLVHANAGDNKPLTFSVTTMGEAEDKAATVAGFHTSHFRNTHLGFTAYDASDGEKAFSHYGDFEGAGGSRLYFDWNLKYRAAQIVKRGNQLDRNGSNVGLRAEYVAESAGKNKTWIVMWTDGENFHSIEAPTLRCALALEREIASSFHFRE